jgi:hypothetical protein
MLNSDFCPEAMAIKYWFSGIGGHQCFDPGVGLRQKCDYRYGFAACCEEVTTSLCQTMRATSSLTTEPRAVATGC